MKCLSITVLACSLFFLFSKGECLSLRPKGPHRLYIGPEFYHVERTKKGGSSQKGWLYGGRAVYERRVHNGLYWAADYYWAKGEVEGNSSSGNKLKSDLTDQEVEGRIGYAFCCNRWNKLTLIPLLGYGYYESDNSFKKPSPLIYEFCNSYQYIMGGVEAGFFIRPCLECGVVFKVKYMTEGKSKIKDDPDFDDFSIIINNETQYEVDLPFRLYSCLRGKTMTAVFSPFYRYRHFGGRMNWPFDFIDTKFKNYGARILVNILF